MRFFEFNTSNSSNTVSQLVDLVKDPKTDDKLRQDIMSILKSLTDKTPETTESSVVDANIVAEIESDEDYYQRILNSDLRLKAIAERKIKEAEAAAFKVGYTLSAKDVFSQFNNEVLSLVKNLTQLPPDFSKELTKTFSHLAAQGIDQNQLISFLKDAATPDRIINLPSIVSKSGSGSLPIPSQYRDIVQALAVVTPGSKNAASGKGELVLAVIGKDTTKPSIGDIVVGNKRVEVKASDEAKGSLSDFALGGQPVEKARKIMVDTINRVLGRTVLLDAPASSKDEATGATGISAIGVKNLPKLNELFKEMGEQETKEMFKKMFLAVVGSKFNDDIEKIVTAIDSNGIQLEKMRRGVVELLFNYYKSINGHSGLLTLNVPKLTYNYVEDSEAFASLKDITIGSLFDFRSNPGSITTFKQK